MTTNDRTITEQLPDLPALESAEGGPRRVLLAVGITMGLALAATGAYAWFYWKYRELIIELLPQATFGLGAMIAGCVWLAAHLLAGDYHWQTDVIGITTRSLLRCRTVSWQDVEEAFTERSLAGTEHYALRTRGGRMIRLRSAYRDRMLNVYGSIWQHLRRLEKASDLRLPEAAMTFWDRIPDELPREMKWTNGRMKWTWPLIALCLLFTGMFVWGALDIFLHGGRWGAVLTLLPVPLLLWGCRAIIRRSPPYAREVHLTGERLEAQTVRGPVSLAWSEVSCGRWRTDTNTNAVFILIGGGRPYQEVAVSHVPFSEDSYKLILAIIRRLRTAGVPQALTIPTALRSTISPDSQSCSTPPVAESVALDFTAAECLAIAVLLTAPISIPLAIWLVGATNAGLVAPVPPLILSVIGWLAAETYSLRADRIGVTKRFMFWRKAVAWQDITAYEVHASRHASSMLKRLLKGRDGKTLIDITPDAGRKQDQERFLAYVHARLAEVLPAEALSPPWKARPWTPS